MILGEATFTDCVHGMIEPNPLCTRGQGDVHVNSCYMDTTGVPFLYFTICFMKEPVAVQHLASSLCQKVMFVSDII